MKIESHYKRPIEKNRLVPTDREVIKYYLNDNHCLHPWRLIHIFQMGFDYLEPHYHHKLRSRINECKTLLNTIYKDL